MNTAAKRIHDKYHGNNSKIKLPPVVVIVVAICAAVFVSAIRCGQQDMEKIHPFTITMFAVVMDTDGRQKLHIVCGTTEFLISEFSKTVFLTREKAERALKARDSK